MLADVLQDVLLHHANQARVPHGVHAVPDLGRADADDNLLAAV